MTWKPYIDLGYYHTDPFRLFAILVFDFYDDPHEDEIVLEILRIQVTKVVLAFGVSKRR